jgi:hypothetical protein
MNQAQREATYHRFILATDPPTQVVRSKQMRGAWMQLRAVPALGGGSLVSAAWADDLSARRASRALSRARRACTPPRPAAYPRCAASAAPPRILAAPPLRSARGLSARQDRFDGAVGPKVREPDEA